MKTVTLEVFGYDELSDEAKKKAIKDHRDWNIHYEWWDSVYDMAIEAGKLIGIEIEPKSIWFSGFGHQGQGCCFSGRYDHVPGMVENVKKEFPSDKKLLAIAETLSKWDVSAVIKGERRYSVSTSILDEIEDDSEFSQAISNFSSWIFSCLEREYDYLTSDEAIAESLIANGITFLEDGEEFSG